VTRARSVATITAGALAAVAVTAVACGPELPDEPYACAESGLCPDGYTCRSTVCVKDGSTPVEARPLRISWINSAEMYWFDGPEGGADLVVNDGFTPGGRGLYEIHVSPDGEASDPALIFDFGEEFPTSSSVVALDAGHYGLLTMTFPPVTSTDQAVSFYSLDRDTGADQSSKAPVSVEKMQYLGGSEPAYVSAVRREDGSVDVAYGDPNGGGRVVFARIEDGVWKERFKLDLPSGVLPLSADCLLWDVGDGLLLRLGLESPVVYYVADSATDVTDVGAPLPVDGLPIYGFADSILTLTTNDDATTGTYRLVDYDGNPIGSSLESAMQGSIEPHTGSVHGAGALVAPLSTDSSFAKLEVAFVTPTGIEKVGSFERAGSDDLYSARAFVRDGRVYLAWTSFHDAVMDLWVATFAAEGLE
jgi:hypothetical protein